MTRDTIFALSTGRGRAALAVIRVSGPQAGDAVRSLIGRLPAPRRARLARLTAPDSGEMLDEALVLWLPGPASATGEDVAEFHVHGGRAVVAAVLGALAALPGLRPAEAGEFARRSFLAGKLDLAAAESLADLIDAETAAQRRQALRGLGGALGRAVESWREQLIGARALVEASIDFSDEGDVVDLSAEAIRTAADIAAEIDRALRGAGAAERLREGAVVVVAGPPNAGKSSLLNRAAGRDVAIVTEIAGTTRDALEVALDLEGYPALLIDTAGLRETADPVEAEGVRRARARIARADLVLWVTAPDAGGGDVPASEAPVWQVENKTDLGTGGRGAAPTGGFERSFAVSCRTGEGLDHLFSALAERVGALLGRGEAALVTQVRQRQALEDALRALRRASGAGDAELVAEDLRGATDALGRVTGRVDAEQVLDAVFGRFCIGK